MRRGLWRDTWNEPHCPCEIQKDCSLNSVRCMAACYLFVAEVVTLLDVYWFDCMCACVDVSHIYTDLLWPYMERECFSWAAEYFRACVRECLVLSFMANLLPYVSCNTRSSTESPQLYAPLMALTMKATQGQKPGRGSSLCVYVYACMCSGTCAFIQWWIPVCCT